MAVGRVELADDGAQTMPIVCCGTPVHDHVTVIVDPDCGRILEANQVGEVWFGGPSVAAGYWRNPVATAATFQAMTACGQGPFMRTGDLGFLCEGGLYITGRIKELMIVRGRNVYPNDIESTLVEATSSFSEVQAAVFAAGSDEATGVVAYLELPRRSKPELAQELPRVANALRQAVSQAHDVLLRDIYFVSHGTIPRTSSGKTQRNRCAAMYLTREIDASGNTLFSTRQATAPDQPIGSEA
jgi:acyl-CoA synthetase (AMP-forming)/AMP-acid ligase II